MKNLIKKEIQSYKEKYPNNKSYVQRLQQMLDIDVYTQKDFISTGSMQRRKRYESNYPSKTLDKNCCDVMVYLGGYKIEMLCTGEFLFEGESSKKIDKLENILYKKYIAQDV
tara:strand:- start:420 stop:755 length:336 start_codon:yes stop_codon:yes gene_type:complete